MFGDNSSGFINENKIIEYLNSTKYFNKLNINFKSFLTFLYNQELNNKTIEAYKPKGQVKADIGIIINNKEKFISVKKGSGNSIHQEKLFLFEKFLIKSGISLTDLNYLKEFHYGDNTIDGSGEKRFKSSIWIKNHQNETLQINEFLNSERTLKKCLDRFLFAGNIENAPIVNAIYHGTIENGLWASKEEIFEYLIPNKKNNLLSIHFSNLNYQVWNRNLKFNPRTENRRHVMQIKWSSLAKDLENIKNKRK